MKAIACSLYTDRYQYGIAALVNSLIANGYRGIFWVGYTGILPTWAQKSEQIEVGFRFKVTDDCLVNFVKLDNITPFSANKPALMQLIFQQADENCDFGIIFLDADSLVKCDWSFFEKWLELGVGCVIDGHYPICDANHPWAADWSKVAKALGYSFRDTKNYFSSALIAVPKKYQAVVSTWKKVLDYVREHDLKRPGDRSSGFCLKDQDEYNVALRAVDFPLSVMPSSAIDYGIEGFLVSHSFSARKAWDFSVLESILYGQIPKLHEKLFWENVSSPIEAFSAREVTRKKWELKLASLIGRFYSRSPIV